ncbi:hypothetical protein [Pseudogulbenkiania sp. NH8B]|uniref:hypothetical protein n=1 Tax=Pseudogulbenkiania sp. (strain NH8B) TaxID=748280 RepID=UPI00031E17D3|nr:hypothetical protein [Pseudogulbenkiania sp. NH8B]
MQSIAERIKDSHAVQPKRPPFNALMLAATFKAAAAIEALSQSGLTVVKVELETPARPTIRIQTCGQCRRLIESGDAVYFSYGQMDHFGPYREGQFQLGGCRIVWTEFGH